MSALSVAMRLARRDARRSRGRSALVVAMIALPVIGVGAADVLWRTFQLSPEQKATREMGAADAVLEDTFTTSISQYGRSSGYALGEVQRVGASPAASSVLPAGSVVQALPDSTAGTVAAADLLTEISFNGIDLDAPLTQGMVLRRDGRAARTPKEVVLSQALADRLHVGIGDTVSVAVDRRPAAVRTVVGLGTPADSAGERSAWLAPGELAAQRPSRWLVDAPGRLTWDDVRRANAAGFVLRARTDLPGQPPVPYAAGLQIDAAAVTAVSLVVGMTLLEVVLLAGPAFAVGAKRRARELALLTATGAEPRDVRRTVLCGGVVLGAVGGLVGVVLATGLAAAALPRLTDLGDALPGPFEVRPLEMLGIALVGVLTATLAAVLPARSAARQDVVAALTGRRGAVRTLRRTPVLGALAAVTGAVIALEGARRREVNVILAGSATAELGLVALTPFLVGLVGRLSVLLPLGPRLALRDASRNRGRTAPAVSAVLAAVAGSVAVATYFASQDRYAEQHYFPNAPYGSSWVNLDGRPAAAVTAAETALRTELPGARVLRVEAVGAAPGGRADAAPVAYANLRPGCDDGAGAPPDPSSCNGSTSAVFSGVLVGDLDLVQALTGLPRDQLGDAARALASGGAVVSPFYLRANGTAVVAVDVPAATPADERPTRTSSLKAVSVPGPLSGLSVVSPEAARRIGLPLHTTGLFAATSTPPTGAQEDHIRSALAKAGIEYGLSVERGYQKKYGLGLLALLVGSAVIVLGASGIATGLAAADGRADLATLAAVGASPRTRRNLAAFQSAVTAGLGTLLGTVAGLVPAVAMVRALNATVDAGYATVSGLVPGGVEVPHYPLVVPWTNVLVTLLVVPALAAVAAWLLTRSRLPLVARLA